MFEFTTNATFQVEIEGNTYTGVVDSPEFIAYWDRNRKTVEKLAELEGITEEKVQKMGNRKLNSIFDDTVTQTVELVSALFGVDEAKTIFNGRERSLVFCTELMQYIFTEMENADIGGSLSSLMTKYSSAKVL